MLLVHWVGSARHGLVPHGRLYHVLLVKMWAPKVPLPGLCFQLLEREHIQWRKGSDGLALVIWFSNCK